MKDNDKLNKIFGIETTPENTEIEIIPPENNEEDEKTKEDLSNIRDNLNNIIKLGTMGISDLSDLAAQSQDDKMYGALARVISAVVLANKTLLDLNLKKKEALPVKETPNIINNNLILTTTEFQKLQQQKEFKEDEE